MNPLLQAALEYAAHRWWVLPVVPGQKNPLTTHGVYDATTDAEIIKGWWKKWPNANVAVACGEISGITVVDVDVDAEKGIDERKIIEGMGDLPKTLTQNTPRGGYHLFYKYQQGVKNAREKSSGLLIRNDGGYVLISPSSTEHGNYVWQD